MPEEKINSKPTSFVITLDDYIGEQQKESAVADRLGSDDIQKVIGKIAEEFGLNPAALAYAVEYAILKKDLAVYLPDLLKENLNVDSSLAVKVATVVAEKMFPIFKDRLAEKEKYQGLWKDMPKATKEIDTPKGREVKGSAPVVAPTAKGDPLAPKSNFEKRAKDEMEVEINKNKKSSFAKVTADAVSAAEDILTLKVKSIVSSSQIAFTDPALQRRLETIISARLRDVRDESETKEMLLRGEKVGGLGLNVEQTERVLKLLAVATSEFTAEYSKAEEAKRKEFIKGQLEKEALRRQERERKEREEREKLYARVTGITPTIKEVKRQELKVNRPETPKTLSFNSELSTPVFQLLTKPRVEEIKFTPKIKGPVEELGAMVLEELRRMSKDPKMAIEKIKDKLELLGEENFIQKMQGIAAWQGSAVNKAYLDLLKESLARGVAPIAVIEEYAKAAKPTLTKEEFDAIMELNRSLRF